MKLSAGTVAVREAGYGSRAEFNRIRETILYQSLASRWAAANGVSVQSTRDPRSRFAKAFGRSFYKDGKVRPEGKRPPSYLKRVIPDDNKSQAEYWKRYLPNAA